MLDIIFGVWEPNISVLIESVSFSSVSYWFYIQYLTLFKTIQIQYGFFMPFLDELENSKHFEPNFLLR